jgi:hypothetical protein
MAYDFSDPNFDFDKWAQEQFGPQSGFASNLASTAYTNIPLPSLETPEYQKQIEEQVAKDFETNSKFGYSEFGAPSGIGNIFGVVLAVASLAVPGIGKVIGSSILSAVGITGASAAVTAGVGAAALSAASTAAQGGSVEDVLKSAASAGVASGLNIGMGGGVSGAVTGSTAGTIIRGGDASQVLTNAFAAGVGAGVQGALPENPDAGKIIGSAARTYIATGGNVDQTLLNTAAAAIGTLDKPTTYAQTTTAQPAEGAAPFKYGNDTYQELEDGTAKVTTQSGNVRILSADTFNEIKQDYAADVAAGAVVPPAGPVIPPQTVAEVATVVSPTVTGLDLVKQVAAQPIPTVDPKALEQVIVQGQGANVANVSPVETTVPSATVPSAKTVATPTPEQPFPTPTVTPEKESEVVTDVPVTRPDTTSGLSPESPDFGSKLISETVPPPVTTGPVFEQKTIRETVPRLVDPAELGQKTIQETVPKISEVVTDVPVPPPAPPAPPTPPTPPARLEEVTVRETVPKVSDVVTDVSVPPAEPPPAPPPPPAPEVKAEEPKKEEPPKKEAKKLYPTVTSVPPPKRPGRQPIITGASPARLLADALAAYRPAGAIEGEESGKERQNVWNEKSLRLKDALGL